ncbi:hypothetical protein D0863_09062 [Hortaea werneckii]|uniref:F-box domain-containing protein n=1 Tax=Hortaea werneckii TaxID=91943 RepID=A0A3M7DNR2_HORWE|nr:hypothetical protein D0863_09062 [Hortaea werneckii]
MQTLVAVPGDIKHYILQFISDPRDLYNLILTCKELRAVALPFYYNTVYVHGNLALPVLAAGLVPTNPGLQHVRHLVIKEPYGYNAVDYVPGACDSRTDIILTFLANLLPHDRLLTFTCDCDVSLSSPILATLYRRQHKLRTLRLDSVDLEPLITSFSRDSLANVATAHISTADPEEASSWNRLLPTLSSLRNLEVAASTDRSDETSPLTADQSSKSQYELHLHALQVQGFDLTDAAPILRRSVHFPELKVLGMQLGENSVRLLEVLYETHELESQNLRTLIIVEAEKIPASRAYSPALSRVLGTFSTLEHLIVRTKSNSAYWSDFGAVAGHAASLRLLHLDCPTPRPLPQGVKRGSGSIIELRKLEQITLPMSNIVLAEADCCATAGCYKDMHYILHANLSTQLILDALPSLRTFQILGMRLGDLNVQQIDRQVLRAYALRQMRTLADYVFNALTNLKVLSLERYVYRNPDTGRRESYSGQCYHRGKTIDAVGREQATAIEASLRELKRIEPAVDILGMEDLEHGGLFRHGYDL